MEGESKVFHFGKKLCWARRAGPAEWVLSGGGLWWKTAKKFDVGRHQGLDVGRPTKKLQREATGERPLPKLCFFSGLFYSGNMANHTLLEMGFQSESVLRYFGR